MRPTRTPTARRAAQRIARRIAQRGLSIVELLVATAIALFIVATGTSVFATHLQDSRSLLLEARLTQDLRVAADVITRDLRRAGHWGGAAQAVRPPGAAASAAPVNPYLAVVPAAGSGDAVSFRYSRDASENQVVDSHEQFGFRLRAGVVEMQLGAGNWQALTDPGSVLMTGFAVTPSAQSVALASLCDRPCPAASPTCPPRQQVRSVAVLLTGTLPRDPATSRSVRSEVRLRADAVTGACAA